MNLHTRYTTIVGFVIFLHETKHVKTLIGKQKNKRSRHSKIQKNNEKGYDLIYDQHVMNNCSIFEEAEQRKNTFLFGWPQKVGIWWPQTLADAGFFYRRNALEIQCFTCKLITSVDTWHDKETPYQAHARLSPTCSLLKTMGDKIHPNANSTPPTAKDSKQFLITNGPSTFLAPPSSNICVTQDISPQNKNSSETDIKAFPDPDGNLHYPFKNVTSGKRDIAVDHGKPNERQTLTNERSRLQMTNIGNRIDNETTTILTDLRPTRTDTDAMNSLLTTDASQSRVTDLPEFKNPQFSSISSRLLSYQKWNFSSKQSPQILAEAGYFFTGQNDIVRCFCCDLGLAEWDPKDNPWTEHARHNPKCWFLKTEKGELFIENIQKDWRKIYNPKHAGFEDKVSRIETFDGWRQDIEQTAEILADAGFFYTGEEDVVRCHYCDGGLRNWEPGDVPWEEHAKWFPFCKFVIKMKGQDYIEEIQSNSERRISEDHYTVQRIPDNPAVRTLKEMQFSSNDIQYAVQEYKRQKGNHSYTENDLIELICNKDYQQPLSKASPFAVHNVPSREQEYEKDPEKIREINRQLKERNKCTRCKTNDICMLFVNCGHRLTCEECAYKMDFCPHCDTKIKNRLKTYLS